MVNKRIKITTQPQSIKSKEKDPLIIFAYLPIAGLTNPRVLEIK